MTLRGLLLGGLTLGAALAACSTPANNHPGSGTSGHPASADVTITACSIDNTLGVPTATAVVTNHSSQTSDYIFQVDFLKGATVVAQGGGAEDNIAAGQTATSSITGDNQTTGTVTCSITNVQRYASS